jgi:hypothetical protein
MKNLTTKNISTDTIVNIKQVLDEACAIISEKVSHKLREYKQENQNLKLIQKQQNKETVE